jgi:hypothetical protein
MMNSANDNVILLNDVMLNVFISYVVMLSCIMLKVAMP